MAADGSTTELPAVPSSSSNSKPGDGTPSRQASSKVRISGPSTSRLESAWNAWKERGVLDGNGTLPVARLKEMLSELDVNVDEGKATLDQLVEQDCTSLSYEQMMTICENIDLPSPSTSQISSQSQVARSPLKKCLSKCKPYLGTGYAVYDDSVVMYIHKLEEHRKKCDTEGRYKEAQAAIERLTDLKTAQVARMRQELMLAQTRELGEVHKVYEEETQKFYAIWQRRIKDYDLSVKKALVEMRDQHFQQTTQLEDQLQQRQAKHIPSKDYLNKKKIESSLVKVKEYGRAIKVREATSEMKQIEIEQAQQAMDAGKRLQMAKFLNKKNVEVEGFLQRSSKGRAELELRRATETEKRMHRFKVIVMELESLHKLEIVSLENFLDAQVQAGKATPIKDSFQRKREQLYNSAF